MHWFEKLELIDKDAADWIRKERSNCIDKPDLARAFLWGGTPQGHKYWEKLRDEVENFKKESVSKRHKHADLIIAWAEGAEIEFKSKLSGNWKYCEMPSWSKDNEYRIKAKTRKEQRRIAVLSYKYKEILSTVHYDFEGSEKQSNFVRWATDIIEVELKGE